MRRLELGGQEIGHFQVSHETRARNGNVQWLCKCVCGKDHWVNGYHLKIGRVVSCGCVTRAKNIERSTTHGMSGTKIYNIWLGIKDRCYNKNNTINYGKYGAVGITVCDRWLESFENFYKDMGDCPEGMSLNRINGAKVYCKENCEWATLSVQAYDQKKAKNNTSGRTGVNFDVDADRWVAQLNVNNKVHKKRFKSLGDAIAYREKLEIEHFGFTKE